MQSVTGVRSTPATGVVPQDRLTLPANTEVQIPNAIPSCQEVPLPMRDYQLCVLSPRSMPNATPANHKEGQPGGQVARSFRH